jgi:hypothetical protein
VIEGGNKKVRMLIIWAGSIDNIIILLGLVQCSSCMSALHIATYVSGLVVPSQQEDLVGVQDLEAE